MDRAYEKSIGTALLAIGLGILLFGFYQAYEYTQSPPSGTYNVVHATGGGGNGSFNITFNGRFLEAFTFLGIEYLVGASILKGGWNLITPKSETIQVRVKPKSLQVEPVGYSVPPTPPLAGPAVSAPTGGARPPVLRGLRPVPCPDIGRRGNRVRQTGAKATVRRLERPGAGRKAQSDVSPWSPRVGDVLHAVR